MKNILGMLLPMVVGQLDSISDSDVVTVMGMLNNWTASALEGNADECDAIIRASGVNDDIAKIARKVYAKCNASIPTN